MQAETIPVLMTGAGAPGAPGILHCLRQSSRLRLVLADADGEAVGRFLHPHFVQIPKATDPGFTAALLQVCRAQGIRAVMPLVTRELFPLSENKHLFEQAGIQVLVSAQQAIALANDKGACYRFLQQAGVPVPRFSVVHTTAEFIAAAESLGHRQRPICFKPAVSNGSRGFRVIGPFDEADLLFHHKPDHTRITFDDALRVLSMRPFPPLVVADYIEGEEYSVDCLAFQGTARLVVPRLRSKMINGISVRGRIVEDRAVIQYCTQVIGALGLHGNIGIQVKIGSGGQPLLLEVNPRVQGSVVTNLGAGVNLPLLAVKQELGLPIAPEELRVAWGVRFTRYWTEVYY